VWLGIAAWLLDVTKRAGHAVDEEIMKPVGDVLVESLIALVCWGCWLGDRKRIQAVKTDIFIPKGSWNKEREEEKLKGNPAKFCLARKQPLKQGGSGGVRLNLVIHYCHAESLFVRLCYSVGESDAKHAMYVCTRVQFACIVCVAHAA